MSLNNLEEFRSRWKNEISGQSAEETNKKKEVKVCDTVSNFAAPKTGTEDVNKACLKNKHRKLCEESFDRQTGDKVRTKQEGCSFFKGADVARLSTTEKPNTISSFILTENLLNAASPCSKRLVVGITEDSDMQSKLGMENVKANPSYLDIFIQDVDELNDVPFFDVELPRELVMKIFYNLDYKMLCRCAQVSLAWKSLADADLLWKRLYCTLPGKTVSGDEDFEEANASWKQWYKERHTLLLELQFNWKNGRGKSRILEYASEGVLVTCSSRLPLVVAGFSNGNVKLWNVQSGEDCVFRPSNVSLVLDGDNGLCANGVKCVATSSKFTIAGYFQGNLDIWDHDADGTSPALSLQLPGEIFQISVDQRHSLIAACSAEEVVVMVPYAARIKSSFSVTSSTSRCLLLHSRNLLYSDNGCLWARSYEFSDEQIQCLHGVAQQSVTCVAARGNHVGFSVRSFLWHEEDVNKVFVCSLPDGAEICKLKGHQSRVGCIDMPERLTNLLVTGCDDGRARLFDLRVGAAVTTFVGMASTLSHVQFDENKVIAGGPRGRVCVWDQRSVALLWEMQNRHSVEHLSFDERWLVCADAPCYTNIDRKVDDMAVLRDRGSLRVLDFQCDSHLRANIPSICLSSFDEPQPYNYNVGLNVPYDDFI